MDNVIEYQPATTTHELNALLEAEVNRWLARGWKLSLEGGLFRLKMAGRPDKVVRNGVIHHG